MFSKVGEKTGPCRVPSQPLSCLRAGGPEVEAGERDEPAKMFYSALRANGYGWNFQAAADYLSDFSSRHSFFGDGVIARPAFLSPAPAYRDGRHRGGGPQPSD